MPIHSPQRAFYTVFIAFTFYLIAGCSASRPEPVAEGSGPFSVSSTPADSITRHIPDYSSDLTTVKGKGKAFISEPENSDRATLYFESNRQKSLITAKNSIGIEGGKLLTDGDTLIVYNKIDDYARIISIRNNNLDNINNLASINLLDILNVPVKAEQVRDVLHHKDIFLLRLQSGSEVYVSKKDLLVRQIDQANASGLPYSRILYDGYQQINGLLLPRKITIFSRDESAKIDLLIQSLEVNPELNELKIDLPDDIKIYRQ